MIDLYELLKKRIEEKPYILSGKRIFYNEMKEVFQELILHALSEHNFFENNAFQGGTSKRLIYSRKVKRLTINGKNIIDIIHNKGIVPTKLTKNTQRQNIEVKIETGYYNSRFNFEKKTLLFPVKYNIHVFDIIGDI